jgi:hypothetical protein
MNVVLYVAPYTYIVSRDVNLRHRPFLIVKVFREVTSCSLVDNTNVLRESAALIFGVDRSSVT